MLWQPRRGYRAGVDPVLLAASVKAQPGQEVLDLGCGVGAAALCLGERSPGLSLLGVERDAQFATLAVRNGLPVVQADVAQLPAEIRARQFDHVLVNPPYYNRTAGKASKDPAREAAHGADTPLQVWMRVAGKRLKPKGVLHVIHRMERLPDILAALPSDLGSVQVLPITSRPDRPAERLILRTRKSGRGAFVMHAPLVMHTHAAHQGDSVKDYSARVQAVLRDGAPLDF